MRSGRGKGQKSRSQPSPASNTRIPIPTTSAAHSQSSNTPNQPSVKPKLKKKPITSSTFSEYLSESDSDITGISRSSSMEAIVGTSKRTLDPDSPSRTTQSASKKKLNENPGSNYNDQLTNTATHKTNDDLFSSHIIVTKKPNIHFNSSGISRQLEYDSDASGIISDNCSPGLPSQAR